MLTEPIRVAPCRSAWICVPNGREPYGETEVFLRGPRRHRVIPHERSISSVIPHERGASSVIPHERIAKVSSRTSGASVGTCRTSHRSRPLGRRGYACAGYLHG